MTKLEKIEHEIASLSLADVDKLADWLAEYKAALWDIRIEADAKSGKLNSLIKNAKNELAEGKVRAL